MVPWGRDSAVPALGCLAGAAGAGLWVSGSRGGGRETGSIINQLPRLRGRCLAAASAAPGAAWGSSCRGRRVWWLRHRWGCPDLGINFLLAQRRAGLGRGGSRGSGEELGGAEHGGDLPLSPWLKAEPRCHRERGPRMLRGQACQPGGPKGAAGWGLRPRGGGTPGTPLPVVRVPQRVLPAGPALSTVAPSLLRKQNLQKC